MTSIDEDERLDMRQPFQEQLLALANRGSLCSPRTERTSGIRVAHQMSFAGIRSDSL